MIEVRTVHPYQGDDLKLPVVERVLNHRTILKGSGAFNKHVGA
jgi:hypothetical protein